MGKFASFGTPIAVNLASGVVGSVMCILVFATASSLAGFFAVMLALTISTTVLTYVFVFPALLILRRKFPDANRPYRYYSPGLLRRGPPFRRLGLGGLGGCELGVVMVPSGAGLVAAAPS